MMPIVHLSMKSSNKVLASDYTGIKVKQMLFGELCDVDKYDGIWACSSILHLSKDTLADVLKKMTAALKDSGVIYTSFKYGEFEGERNGRYFTDFTIEAFKEYLQNIPELQIEEYWITGDVRPGRGESIRGTEALYAMSSDSVNWLREEFNAQLQSQK